MDAPGWPQALILAAGAAAACRAARVADASVLSASSWLRLMSVGTLLSMRTDMTPSIIYTGFGLVVVQRLMISAVVVESFDSAVGTTAREAHKVLRIELRSQRGRKL